MKTNKGTESKSNNIISERLDDHRKTVAYVRESSKQQANEGYNIHAQEQKCKEYIKYFLDDASEIKMYREKGYSAKTIDRPILNKLIEDVKKGKIKTIVVQKLDRLVRRNKGMYELLELFQVYDVRLITIRENIDTANAMWKIALSMFIMIAEIEQDQISERTNESMEYAASIGSYIKGGIPPFGTYKEKIYREDGSHVITLNRHPWQWNVLEQIYDYADRGFNCKQISVKVSSLPVMLEHNKKLEDDAISSILSNKIYIGIMKLKDKEYKIAFENHMDDKYWHQVQLHRGINLRKNPLNEYAYHGKVFCDCGAQCVVDVTNKRLANGTIKKYKYYVCPVCGKRISEQTLIESVEPKIKHKYEVEIDEKRTGKIATKIYRINELKEDLNKMYIEGELDRKLYIENLKKSNEQIERLEARKKAKKKRYDKLTSEERKEYIEQSIECIKVQFKTKKVQIHTYS